MSNPFASGMDFGSHRNCIMRLQINLPPLLLMMGAGREIHEHFMVGIYEDSCAYFNDDSEPDLSMIEDENLRSQLELLIPDLKRLFAYVNQ